MEIKFILHIDPSPEEEAYDEGVIWQNTERKMAQVGNLDENDLPTYEDVCMKANEVEGLSMEERAELTDLLWEYREIFRGAPGRFSSYTHKLIVNDKKPFLQKGYSIPMQHREKVDKAIEKMLKYGIIERSTTLFINPMLPVIKTDDSVRLCMDARELNKRLQPDRDGPEEMDKVLRKCDDVKIMSSIDLTTSFWQVPLDEQSKKYCGFEHAGKTYHNNTVS